MDLCLKSLSNSYLGCEEEISELIYQINKMLNEKKLEWESSYNKLLESHNRLSDNLLRGNIEIEDKDAEIMDLRKEITVIDKSNYEKRMVLESKICELSQTVAELKSHLKSNPKFTSSNSQDTLELTISALKKECDYYQDKIAELEVVQTTHTTQVKLLEGQRSSILKKNEELKQKFSNCRKEYHAKLSTTDSELNSLAKQRQEYEANIKALKATITEKEEAILSVKDTLEDVLSSNHKNNTLFSKMQKNFDVVTNEKSSLLTKLGDVEMENQELQRDSEQLSIKLEFMEKSVENTSCGAKSEVGMLKAQLDIYVKENDFLRTFLLQQDRTIPTPNNQLHYLEKLEADNNSLKENIHNMETEIANLIKLTEQSNRSGAMYSPTTNRSEVRQVKERYERHLHSMKAEVEQLTLENLSLKAMHHNCDHSIISGLESNGNSVVLSNNGDQQDIEKMSVSTFNNVPPSPLSLKSERDTSSITPLSRNEQNRSKSASVSLSDSLTKEFEELQKNVLKQFEARLNECVSNFSADKE